MVAAIIAMAAFGVACLGIIAYLTHALVSSRQERQSEIEEADARADGADKRADEADKRFRDELAVAETYLGERNEAVRKRAEADAEMRILSDRITRLGIAMRQANDLLVKSADRQLSSGDVAAVSAAVDELLRTPLPGAAGAQATTPAAAAGGNPTATTMRIAIPPKPGKPDGDPQA